MKLVLEEKSVMFSGQNIKFVFEVESSVEEGKKEIKRTSFFL